MATTSAMEIAEDALLVLLLADGTLAALSDTLGKPRLGEPQDPARECVWIYEDAQADQNQATTGQPRGTRWETITLRVGVLVTKSEDWKAVRDRLAVLANIVENIVRNTPNLGSSDIYDTTLLRTERSAGQLSDERRAGVKILTFEAEANIA